MRFAPARNRTGQREAVVPMINVVFLLLIFFLMTASLGARAPFDVVLPAGAGGGAADAPGVLYIAADGTLSFRGVTGAGALAAIAAEGDAVLDIRADRALPAADLAALLPRLSALGVDDARIVTVRD